MAYKITREDLDELFGDVGADIDEATLVHFIASKQLTEGQAAAYRCLLAKGGTVELRFQDMLSAGIALSTLATMASEVHTRLSNSMHALRQLHDAVRYSPALKRVATLDWIALEQLANKLRASDVAPDERSSAPDVASTSNTQDDTQDNRPAPTLDELALKAGPRDIALPEDVVLGDDGRVRYESGKPFDDVLSRREIRLLEMSKRLLCPSRTPSRTAHEFRRLPKNL